MSKEGNLDQTPVDRIVPVVKVGNLNEVVGQPNHKVDKCAKCDTQQ